MRSRYLVLALCALCILSFCINSCQNPINSRFTTDFHDAFSVTVPPTLQEATDTSFNLSYPVAAELDSNGTNKSMVLSAMLEQALIFGADTLFDVSNVRSAHLYLKSASLAEKLVAGTDSVPNSAARVVALPILSSNVTLFLQDSALSWRIQLSLRHSSWKPTILKFQPKIAIIADQF
jgi:hypothetical protein